MEVDNKLVQMDFNSMSVKCSWSEVKNEAKDAFSFVDFTREENDEEDACSTIVPESCVFLCRPEGTEQPLTIDINANDSTLEFRKILVISESNFIEVYGLFGEYLKTAIGQLIEDVDGTLAFSCLIEDIKLSQVTLKFVGLKGAKEMWLFGGRVWIEKVETVGSFSRLNMERIDFRLSEGNCQLSRSADSLKKLVTEYVNRNGSADQSCLENLARDLARNRRETQQSEPSTSRNFSFAPSTYAPTPPIEFWKTYIDSSLKNMENRIMDNITEQIRELELRQNKRLDHILKLLENTVPASNNNP